MKYGPLWEALLDEIDDFLEDQEDIRDGENGEQLPNKAMSLLTSLRYLRPAVTEDVVELARELEGLKAAKGYVQDYRATGPNGEPVAAICATDGCAMQRTPSPEGTPMRVPPGYVQVDEILFQTILKQLTAEQHRAISMAEGSRLFKDAKLGATLNEDGTVTPSRSCSAAGDESSKEGK